MSVFVSSTCYDLVDLRDELYEDLRDLGVEVRLSDIKESDFTSPPDAITSSIENCLVNLRACDTVIVVLSQRYGPPLPRPFPPISATHVEYREAVTQQKRVLFYVRNQLVSDWSAWKRNKRSGDFVPAWASPKDAFPLFGFIEEHQQLVGGNGEASRNNWFWPFASSFDLKARVRKDMHADVARATAEQLIRRGQAPVVMIYGQGVSPVRDGELAIYSRFEFYLVNAGTGPALALQGTIDFGNGNEFSGNDGMLATVRPEDPQGTRRVGFDVPRKYLDEAYQQTKPTSTHFPCDVAIRYKLCSGHILEDRTRIVLDMGKPELQFVTSPLYIGKRIIGMSPILLA